MRGPNWKQVLTTAEIQTGRQQLVSNLVKKTFTKPLVLCCILKGAAYFVVDLSRDLYRCGIDHSIYFVEASSYNNEQEQDEHVELLSRLVPSKFENKHVLLVDELYDNGKTMYTVKQHLIEHLHLKESDVTTCVMFAKRNKTTHFPKPDFVGLTVPNVWLVGYGLDDQGLSRGLDSLWAIPKTKHVEWTSDDWRIFIGGEKEKK